jgi:hypothetical protein
MGRPLARSSDLFVDRIGDELLVYDSRTSRAHSLNEVSAAVWKACDGRRSSEQIALCTGLDLSAVELALDSLAEVELITGHERTGVSRRTVLRRATVGAAGIAIALPVIRSITAPTAAMAAASGAVGVCQTLTCKDCGPACGAASCYSSYCSDGGSCNKGHIPEEYSACAGQTCHSGGYCNSKGSCYTCFEGSGVPMGASCSSGSGQCYYGSTCVSGTCAPK